MVTHNPLHRSRRAALPHRAPALGHDVEACPGIWMADAGGGQPAIQMLPHALAREAVFLTAAAKSPVPQSSDRPTKDADGPAVQRHPKIADVPGHDCAHVGALLRD